MKRYIATSTVSVASGAVLALTKTQAAVRIGLIEPVKVNKDGAGTYVAVSPLQFKKGEEIGYDGELPKSMADLLVDPKEIKQRDAEAAEQLDMLQGIQRLEQALSAAEKEAAAQKARADAAEAKVAELEAHLAAAGEQLAAAQRDLEAARAQFAEASGGPQPGERTNSKP